MYEETIEKIKEECRIRNHSDLSCKQYVYHMSCFLKWIGDKPLDELTLVDARDYIVFKRNTTCSPATRNGINSALSFFYRIILRKAWVYEEVSRMKEDWTLPAVCTREEIERLTYANQRRLYDALYHAANRTLTELSADPKRFGAKIGFICVLHTWGSKLNYHPHLHVIVLGGGLDRMNHWKDKGRKFFLPVKVMSAVFKKHYLAELKELRENGDLNHAGKCEPLRNGHAFKELLDRLYGRDWIAYSKKMFAGAREVFKYLGKYTHRIAVSNRRIISVGEKDVTFYAKDYCADGKYKPFTLSGEAFLSRFLLHVLPSGFVKIRYYGLLACRCKKEKVALCRKLLGCREYQSELREKTAAEKIKILFGRDVSKCSRCGKKLNTFT